MYAVWCFRLVECMLLGVVHHSCCGCMYVVYVAVVCVWFTLLRLAHVSCCALCMHQGCACIAHDCLLRLDQMDRKHSAKRRSRTVVRGALRRKGN